MDTKPEIHHTFLRNQGTWSVKGIYFNKTEKAVNVSGEIKIKHESQSTINS